MVQATGQRNGGTDGGTREKRYRRVAVVARQQGRREERIKRQWGERVGGVVSAKAKGE